MDSKRKDIQVLKEKINDTYDDLSTLYKDLGRRLLTDSYKYVDKEKKLQFDGLMSNREESSNIINSIRQGVDRLQEIEKFETEINKHIDSLRSEMYPLFELLGQKIFQFYDTKYDTCFKTAYQIVQEEGKKLLDKQEKIRLIKEKIETASFFNKIILHAKLIPLETSLSQHNAKTSKSFTEGASSLFESGILQKDFESGILNPEISNALQPCLEQQKKIDDQSTRKQTLVDEKISIKNTFSQDEENINPLKKIEGIKVELASIDQQINGLCEEIGLSFLNSRISDTGDEISNDVAYSEWVLQGKLLRKNLVEFSKELKILELEEKIVFQQQIIDSSNIAIKDNEVRIKKIQEQNDDFSLKIATAEETKNNLLLQKDIIEKEK